MTVRSVLMAFVSVVVSVICVGCGRGISPSTAPVSGKVLFKGKPTAGIQVTFHPKFDMGKVKFTPSGVTDKDGNFRLSTASSGDGAPPGEYVATFTFPVTQTDRKSSGIEEEVDFWKGKYADPAQSKWPIQIKKGSNDLEPFRVE